MGKLFWLSDTQWAAIEPHLPKNQPGARRVDDRRVISGIIHVLKTGCRWCDCPPEYGPSTTIYNRFNRWSRRRFWTGLVEALAGAGASPKAHPSIPPISRRIAPPTAAKGGKSAGYRPLTRWPNQQAPCPDRCAWKAVCFHDDARQCLGHESCSGVAVATAWCSLSPGRQGLRRQCPAKCLAKPGHCSRHSWPHQSQAQNCL